MTLRIAVDASRLAVALANVLPHAGADDMMPVLASLRLEVSADGLKVVATDRYTLAWETVGPSSAVTDGKVDTRAPFLRDGEGAGLLSARDAKTVAATLKRLRFGRVTVEIEPAMIRFIMLDSTLTFAAVGGEYPSYHSLVPATGTATGPVDMIGFTPSFLARFATVTLQEGQPRGKNAKKPAMTMRFYGAHKPAAVCIGETFRAIIMPVKIPEGAS